MRGRTWVVACPARALYVTLFAGRPDEADLRELARAYRVRASTTPHAVLFDGSRVEAIDPGAHELLFRSFEARRSAFTPNLVRAAFVHGDGVPGAVFAGYRRLLPLGTCETRSFRDTGRALAWLGADDDARAKVDVLAASLVEGGVELARLRALLAERPHLGLSEAARALAVAPRSLQRALAASGTTFRDEARGRVEAAPQRRRAAR